MAPRTYILRMNSTDEALEAINKVVELDPADCEAWYVRARMLRTAGKTAEARASLKKGLTTKRAKDQPEFAHQICFELGEILESDGTDPRKPPTFSARPMRILEHPRSQPESGAHVGIDPGPHPPRSTNGWAICTTNSGNSISP